MLPVVLGDAHIVLATGCAVITAGVFTVSVAIADVTEGAQTPVTITRYLSPLIATVGAVTVYVAEVAPAMLVKAPPATLTCHWKVLPVTGVAATVNVALLPAQTVALAG